MLKPIKKPPIPESESLEEADDLLASLSRPWRTLVLRKLWEETLKHPDQPQFYCSNGHLLMKPSAVDPEQPA